LNSYLESRAALNEYLETKLLLDTLALFEKQNLKKEACRIRISLAERMRLSGNYEAGRMYLRKATADCPELGFCILKGRAFDRMAAILFEYAFHRQQSVYYDSAVIYAERAIEIADTLKDDDLLVSSLVIKAAALNNLGRLDEAGAVLIKALHLDAADGETTNLPLLSNLAEYYILRSNFEQAFATINVLVKEAEKTGNTHSIVHSLNTLAKYHEATGEDDLRADVFKRMDDLAIEKELIILNLLHRQLISGHEVLQSMEQIDKLSHERGYLVRNSRLLLFLVLLVSIAIIIALYFIHLRNKKIGLLEDVFSLERQSDKLVFDNMRLQLQLKEEENSRLASEMAAKESNLVAKALLIIQNNQFLAELLTDLRQFNLELKTVGNRKSLTNIITLVKSQVKGSSWEELEQLYSSGNSIFIKNLMVKHPDLTPFDKRLCMLLQMNLTTKEIADITMQSFRAIEMARYRLRIKLQLDRDENLPSYLMQFSLQ
jgi:tetratricopeptide (TPR) repeat protein